jgi:molybdate transport system ATP-binding protein
MSLVASVRAELGALHLDVDLNVSTGELVAVLGPNGAGKTSLLQAIAGLVTLVSGRVVLDDRVLEDVDAKIFVPVEERAVGLVFQEYLLFPHLSVLDNIAFGLRARGVAKESARSEAMVWLDRLGLAGYARDKPNTLSGGQAQRVALARALVIKPRLLLLDEPLAALDAGSRAEMRRSLRRILQEFEGTRLLVTHDPVEALSMADRVLVLEEGKVIQSGSPDELRTRPGSRYVADLVGINLFSGRAHGEVVTLDSGAELAVAELHEGDVFAVMHPRAISLFRGRPDGSPRNVWPAVVEDLELIDERVRVRLKGVVPLVAEVTRNAVSSLDISAGTEVWVSVKATEIVVYPS